MIWWPRNTSSWWSKTDTRTGGSRWNESDGRELVRTQPEGWIWSCWGHISATCSWVATFSHLTLPASLGVEAGLRVPSLMSYMKSPCRQGGILNPCPSYHPLSGSPPDISHSLFLLFLTASVGSSLPLPHSLKTSLSSVTLSSHWHRRQPFTAMFCHVGTWGGKDSSITDPIYCHATSVQFGLYFHCALVYHLCQHQHVPWPSLILPKSFLPGPLTRSGALGSWVLSACQSLFFFLISKMLWFQKVLPICSPSISLSTSSTPTALPTHCKEMTPIPTHHIPNLALNSLG